MERISGFMRIHYTPPSGVCSRRIGPADAIVIAVAVVHKTQLLASVYRTFYLAKVPYLFIGEFAIFRVLTHLVPYLKIQCILVNELTSMTPKSKNTCRKLRVSAFKWY
jgi:hypothetical protein